MDLCFNVILGMLEPKPLGLVVTILFTEYRHFIQSQNWIDGLTKVMVI